MANDRQYQSDINIILSHRHDLGADLWTTPDKRLGKGGAFSIYNSALMLLELGMKPDSPILKEVAELFFSIWREDGRFKMYPKRRNTPMPHGLRCKFVVPNGICGG